MMPDLRLIGQIESGWCRIEPDGSVTHGKLKVDADGVVRFVPDNAEKEAKK